MGSGFVVADGTKVEEIARVSAPNTLVLLERFARVVGEKIPLSEPKLSYSI